ncbi:hypothetical protein ACFQE1_11620 [Halobium palmae]|uniref:Ig-like domain-containing protein n=1 Tax=Halobium palmae TaxID=1776492 RepID=A0ABD5S0N9_9EURY
MPISRRAFVGALVASLPVASGCASEAPGDTGAASTGTTPARTTSDGATAGQTTSTATADSTAEPRATATPERATTARPTAVDPDMDLLVSNHSGETISLSVRVTDRSANEDLFAESYRLDSPGSAGVRDLVTEPGEYAFSAELSGGQRAEATWSPNNRREALWQGVTFYVPEPGDLRVRAPDAE